MGFMGATLLLVMLYGSACSQLAAGTATTRPALEAVHGVPVSTVNALQGKASLDQHPCSCTEADTRRIDAGLPVSCIKAAVQQSGEYKHNKDTWFQDMLISKASSFWTAAGSMSGTPGSSALLDSSEVPSATALGSQTQQRPQETKPAIAASSQMAAAMPEAAVGRRMLTTLHQMTRLHSTWVSSDRVMHSSQHTATAAAAAVFHGHELNIGESHPLRALTTGRHLLQPYELLTASGDCRAEDLKRARSGFEVACLQDRDHDDDRRRRYRRRNGLWPFRQQKGNSLSRNG